MAGIIQFTGYFTDEPAPAFERELTTDGATVRVARLSEDTVTIAIERSTGAGDACLGVMMTRNQASALVKMILEAAS